MSRPLRPDWPGRLQLLRERLADEGLDALVVSAAPNLRYLSGFIGSAGLLVVGREEARLVLDGRYTTVAREGIAAGSVGPVRVDRVTDRYETSLASTLATLGARAVGFEASAVTVATRDRWGEAAPDLEWRSTSGLVEQLRVVKDASEVATLRKAAGLLSDVARQLPRLGMVGQSERTVARAIDRALEDAGFERPAFDTIVASGPHSAHPHAVPGDRILSDGDLVVLDFGGVLDGYCVDLTRMAGIGRVSERARDVVRAVDRAQRAAIAAVGPGTSPADVDRAARHVLETEGLGAAFVHSTGHGLGLEVHEAPRLSRLADTDPALAPGMVVTVEPGAYLEGIGGARLEDDVLVTETGHDVLTNAPRDLMMFGIL